MIQHQGQSYNSNHWAPFLLEERRKMVSMKQMGHRCSSFQITWGKVASCCYCLSVTNYIRFVSHQADYRMLDQRIIRFPSRDRSAD